MLRGGTHRPQGVGPSHTVKVLGVACERPRQPAACRVPYQVHLRGNNRRSQQRLLPAAKRLVAMRCAFSNLRLTMQCP